MDAAVEGKPLLLLVNPASGHGRAQALLPKVERELDQRRMVFRVERTQDAAHAIEEALHAVELGEVPVVMSGDGLIGVVGGALAGSEVPLGIVPGGRGNDLARVLGIPDDPAGAVGVLEAGETRRIDVGEVNGQRFLGIASVGFDSDANRIANETKVVRGNLVYAYAAIRALAGWRSARFTVRAGDDRLRFTGWGLAVANNKAYGGGMYAAPDAMLDDGEFDIVMLGDVGKFRFVRSILLKVFKGTHIEDDAVKVFRTPFVELSASRPFAVYADGEHLTDLPASLRILPAALTVVAPQAGA
jgi:YegS/Rv2252/BmrU family lipid kinase